MLECRLLGPIDVIVGERPLPLGPPQRRAVLAALLTDAGRTVSMDAVIDRVWGEEYAPPEARAAVYSHVARLRRTLEAGKGGPARLRLERVQGGYVARVDRDSVDVFRHHRLLDRARDPAADVEDRIGWTREALTLWRGEPLSCLASPWADRMRRSWTQQWLAALTLWAELELLQGNQAAVIDRVSDALTRHPLMESLVGLQMRALFLAGRGAEALAHYAAARRRLAEELGAEPGPELRAVHEAVLREDVAKLRSAVDRGRGPTETPRQLPAGMATFTGRAAELAALGDVLASRDGADHALPGGPAPTRPVPVVVISGAAGVGKTSLAVHWAQQVADQFPDGQLYVNLRGFDAGGRVMNPADAVRGFLDALGVQQDRIPPELEAQSSLYRSLVAGKQIMLLLDNARDADQVRPLLPGARTALVMVTSRNQLTGLVAALGARSLSLDLLSRTEAAELLARALGTVRVAAEPVAVQSIIDACARLPLALTIAAARAQQTGFPLAELAGELGRARDRLDMLDAGNPTSDVRAVFSWSYAALTPPAARLFRLLGLHPGQDISIAMAASLGGLPVPETRRLLTELARVNLISEHRPGRFTAHDLLRVYATELTELTDDEDARMAALGRLLDHCAHTAHAATRLLDPAGEPMRLALAPARPGTRPERLADRDAAMRWLSTEFPGLVAAVRHAAEAGFDRHAWQLAATLDKYLGRRGYWPVRVAAWQVAVVGARRLGDSVAEADAHRGLANAQTWLRLHAEAHEHLRQALDLYTKADDQAGQAATHHHIAIVWDRQGRADRALDHEREALSICRAMGHRRGEAYSLSGVGWYHALLGHDADAVTSCEQALVLHREAGDRYGEAATLDSLGYTHHHAGRYSEAVDCYQRAVDLVRYSGDRYQEASILNRLGDTACAAADPEAARAAWARAVEIFADLDHADATAVRAKLSKLAGPSGDDPASGPQGAGAKPGIG